MTLLLAAGWVIWTATRNPSDRRRAALDRLLTVERPFPAEGRFPGDPYIGSISCAECHPGESALHARSGHASTLRPAGRIALARRLDGTTLADPERPEARWSYRSVGEKLELSREDPDGIKRWVLEYAFGSGHHATTFVTILDERVPEILEHHLTYYSREDRMDLTPGQDAESGTPRLTPDGIVSHPRDSRKCFGCHSTEFSARDGRGIDEATMIPNVWCERCHGPGRAHVAAARRGAPERELAMPFGLDGWTAESQLMLCGTCHRHPSRARPGQIRADNPHLARFQPVGIMQSRCYRESGGALTCVSCHDPHARASADRASYNEVCRSCHVRPDSATEPTSPSTSAPDRSRSPSRSPGVPCPVMPRGDCVDCHMPRVDSGQHILFTDHWIRVRRRGELAPRPRGPAANLELFDPVAP